MIAPLLKPEKCADGHCPIMTSISFTAANLAQRYVFVSAMTCWRNAAYLFVAKSPPKEARAIRQESLLCKIKICSVSLRPKASTLCPRCNTIGS
jgi:hypothetical protein